MESSNMLFWEMMFAAVGMGFVSYGKKQGALIPLFSGVGLFVFPYFVPNLLWLFIIGTLLIILPFIIKI